MMTEKYTDDEVLIFSGKFADEFVEQFTLPLTEDELDATRNKVAEAAEVVMKNWTGASDVPLPKELVKIMTAAAFRSITILV